MLVDALKQGLNFRFWLFLVGEVLVLFIIESLLHLLDEVVSLAQSLLQLFGPAVFVFASVSVIVLVFNPASIFASGVIVIWIVVHEILVLIKDLFIVLHLFVEAVDSAIPLSLLEVNQIIKVLYLLAFHISFKILFILKHHLVKILNFVVFKVEIRFLAEAFRQVIEEQPKVLCLLLCRTFSKSVVLVQQIEDVDQVFGYERVKVLDHARAACVVPGESFKEAKEVSYSCIFVSI